MVGEYMSCYLIAIADREMFAKFGGGYSRIQCMVQYQAARLCFCTNEQFCPADSQSSLEPTRNLRVVATRFGPMLFLSPNFYLCVGLGVCGDWS